MRDSIEYCGRVAREKRASYRHWDYWGAPVANFGSANARLLVVGLAPAAHGGQSHRAGCLPAIHPASGCSGRCYKAGFANQPHATDRADGLRLINCAITAAVHCAPPDNMPSREERERCRQWLESTIDLLPVKVLVALGGLAWDESLRQARRTRVVHGPRAEVRARGDGELGRRTVARGQLPSRAGRTRIRGG